MTEDTQEVSDSDKNFDYFDDKEFDDPSCAIKALIFFSFGIIPLIGYVFFSNL